MFEKQSVIRFFDSLAPGWDEAQILDVDVIERILDNAGVSAGNSILDVASGTGVLVPWYLERKVSSVTAVDISPEMVKIGIKNHPEPEVTFICGDIETLSFDRKFDRVIVFNSFPHFAEPEGLIRRLAELMNPGGMLTIAHSMSREELDQHHAGAAQKVSVRLMSAEKLAGIVGKYLEVKTTIDNDDMYQVVAVKRS